MPLFCRHNRLAADCPVCRREAGAALPPTPAGRRPRGPVGASRTRSRPGAAGLRTRRLERAPDDGYRTPLAPGLRAKADAERLASALAAGAERLAFPGPHPWIAELGDRPAEAARAAFAAVRRSAGTGDDNDATTAAFEAWGERSGSLEAAFTGEPGWSPARRFARVLERLALPRFPRAERYELLVVLGSAQVFALEPDALHPGDEDDLATRGAKRLLVTGDRRLLERRAAALAAACEVPVGALDFAFRTWEEGRAGVDAVPSPAARRALRL